MPAKNKITISVRLEPALAKRVRKLATKAGRSASSLIEWIVDDRIEWEEQIVNAVLRGREEARKGLGMEAEEFFAQLEAESREASESHRHSKRSA